MVEIVLPPIAWLGPWVAFAFIASDTRAHLMRNWTAAGLLVAANLYVLFDVLLRARIRALPRGFVFAGFVLTLSAVVGAYRTPTSRRRTPTPRAMPMRPEAA